MTAKNSSGAKTWKSTRYKHLYKHRSGIYYARLRVNGKLTWRSLRTKVQGVAQDKLAELLGEENRRAELGVGDTSWEVVGDLIAARQAQIANDVSIKPSTKKYWREVFTALKRNWLELETLAIAKVTREQCEDWAGRYAREVSPTRFNNTLGALKRLFEMAVDSGVRHTNPVRHLERVRVRPKNLTEKLPDRATFHKWVAEIRNSRTGWAEPCADLVEFLAYTGLRVGEVPHVLWKHCDRESGEMLVTGDPEGGTKNSETRRVPIIADLENLLARIETRTGSDPNEKVIRIAAARAAMKRAADKIGMAPLTHHDLRHLFATTCIESGVDIPTVSKWLGHKDGGALAMRVYGHLRNQHSLDQAKKVSFS